MNWNVHRLHSKESIKIFLIKISIKVNNKLLLIRNIISKNLKIFLKI